MRTDIHSRALITVTVGEYCLRGTYHRCEGADLAGPPQNGATGVLLINAGFVPRSGDGDVAVYWADSFAQCGYPSFRFDLTALGDSEGDIPPKLLDFINRGGHASAVSVLVRELVGRYNLSGMVVMGLCAGAVTALFGGAATQQCCGVILMDPYFFLPRERTQVRNELSRWSSSTRLGSLAAYAYDCLRYVRLLVCGQRLPGNANRPLLACWQQLIARRASILVLKAPSYRAPGIKPRLGEFDYVTYINKRSHSQSRVKVQLIKGTTHSFADLTGKAEVRRQVENWLRATFPLSSVETTSVRSRAIGA